MNWAIRKNDNTLVKNPGISTFIHDNYDSPFIAYPGDHVQQRNEFKKLNAHFETALIDARVCIVSGFSFRDYDGINQSFEQIMRNENKELHVEISNKRPNFQELTETAALFDNFPRRYSYHDGGIQKLEKQLRSKYIRILRS